MKLRENDCLELGDGRYLQVKYFSEKTRKGYQCFVHGLVLQHTSRLNGILRVREKDGLFYDLEVSREGSLMYKKEKIESVKGYRNLICTNDIRKRIRSEKFLIVRWERIVRKDDEMDERNRRDTLTTVQPVSRERYSPGRWVDWEKKTAQLTNETTAPAVSLTSESNSRFIAAPYLKYQCVQIFPRQTDCPKEIMPLVMLASTLSQYK